MAITLNGTTGITTPDVDSTDLTATGNFTSRGIDDNATSTAMTLDTSGNVLVGTTTSGVASSSSNAGIQLNSSADYVGIARSGGQPLYLNRQSSDGIIADFRKDGATVGSIGVDGNHFEINTEVGTGALSVSGSRKFQWANTIFYPLNDNSANLGHGAYRFKDLYLSGGVYLGGTGAVNKLDDYEEGTFTPVFTASSTAPTVTYSNQVGRYVKIGGMVYVWIRLTLLSSSGGSGNAQVSGLPYTIKNEDSMRANSGGMIDQVASDSRQVSFQGDVGTTKITLIQDGGSTSSHGGFSPTEFGQSSDIRTQFAYFTDS